MTSSKATIEELQVNKDRAEDALKSEVKNYNRLAKKLDLLTKKDTVVSDHAVIRFFERAMGFDIEQVRERIVTNSLNDAIKATGDGKYPICEGLQVVVRNGVAVTVL
jgi:hypothetical protein